MLSICSQPYEIQGSPDQSKVNANTIEDFPKHSGIL